MGKPIVLFRADSNSEIGNGHMLRMLALAEVIVDDFDIFFIIKETFGWIKKEIKKKFSILQIPLGIPLENEPSFISENLPLSSVLIVLDGYSFDTSYQLSIRNKSKLKIISIDDFQPFKYISDAVINHAGMLNESQFEKETYTKLLLGPKYALLRKEFNKIAKSETRVISKVNTAFISLGGTDPDLYDQIINSISKLGITRFILVVNNPDKYEYLKFISSDVELHSKVTAIDMISLMKQSDFAVLPASTLCYEYCSVTGGLFVIQTAENQKLIYNFIIQSGCGFSYNNIDTIIEHSIFVDQLNNQVRVQREYFGGRNEVNLSKAIFQTAFLDKIELRSANEQDLMLHYNWANEPETRNNSFSKEPITLETHIKWYLKKINSLDAALFVLLLDGTPIGSIRFDFNNASSILSFLIEKKYRNKGLGTVILEKGLAKIIEEHRKIKTVNGYVHQNNLASINSFLKVGFQINLNPPKCLDNYNYYSFNILR
jgi:spore coat polysaccharide biosynthesis predicted glycosyltransferase SpsG/RimJ/RimL family protein N-acetyltransferase